MSQRTDWLPGTREGQLAMAKDWQTAAAPKAAAWNIPAAALQGLDALTQTADAALTAAKNETTRTPAKSLRLLAWSLAAGAVLYV